MSYARELAVAERAARAGGAAIRAHYDRGDVAVETKADHSPVTVADRDANDAILAILRAEFPADAILSEESVDDPTRLAQRRVWIVDPLDGTRDFVARTGEFAVHVGLAVDGIAVVGAVYRPTIDAMFSAEAGGGATCEIGETRKPLRVSFRAIADARIGVSRLNASGLLAECLDAGNLRPRASAMGASVKYVALAAGELDAVIALSPSEHEWDTCAPEVVVREAGGRFTDGEGSPFRYNQADTTHHRGSLASNGVCHDELVALMQPFIPRIST